MKKLLFTGLCLVFASALAAQFKLVDGARFPLEPELAYDPAIPSPAKVLGYELGQEYTLYAASVDYFQKLDAASDRVTYHQYGATYEGRPLIRLVITSPENHQNLEAIRQRHLGLVGASEATAADLIRKEPIFVSFSFNIHGNEASSTEAAMQIAYRMAAATDAETQNVLRNAVIILYVCINPDGRDRYLYWYKSVQRQLTATEPRDLDHYEPWPGGRGNHYWFDINRDWVWGIHPETRGLAVDYQLWMPQVHVDYHEQGYDSNYFTMPGTTPRNKLLPDSYEALTDTFGRANIVEFDKHRISYFTRDRFDFFYPGYGSSYPSVMGAIAMLVEQGGIGGGRAVETDDGYVLTLRQRIFDHYTTCIATIKKSVERKEMLLRYSYDTWNPAKSKSGVKQYFLSPNSQYAGDVVGMLLRQGVKVERLKKESPLFDLVDYRTGELAKKALPAGAYVISTNQPRHLFINSVMERNLSIEDSVMYDMATWAAPLAYNLDAYYSNNRLSVETEPLSNAPAPTAGVQNPSAGYAYVIDWQQRNAPQALALLWKKGYRVRAAHEPFSDGKRTYPAGTLVVLLERNEELQAKTAADMADIAASAKVTIDGYDSGRMASGMDLASSRNRPVKQPKVALMVDPPFSSLTAGQIWHLFDQETGLPVERIRGSVLRQTAIPKFGERFGYADLNDYDVLILPDGGSGLGELFKKEQLDAIKEWVSKGGVLIATEGAAPFFAKERSRFIESSLLEMKRDSSEKARYLPFADREDYYGKQRIPGSALNARIDVTHPLAFGMAPDLFTIKFDNLAFKPDPTLQTVGYYQPQANKLLAAGYAAPESLKHLAGNTFAAVHPIGQGKLVLLLDNTQYRMFWRGPSRMMQNAVMLLPGF